MNIGDVVRLRSGGPKMVVIEDAEEGDVKVTCTWFDKNDELNEDYICICALELVEQKRRPKLLVTERESDLTAAKHELDQYLKKKAR